MGLEVIVLAGALLMLPFVVAGFVVFSVLIERERGTVETVWEGYAARRVRELVPARGEWPNRSSPCVRWRSEGVRFELSTVGREAVAFTRLAAWPRERLLGTFVATARKALRETERAPSLDALFERRFAVEEEPAGLGARLLDDRARRLLLGFCQQDRVTFRYQRARLRLEWTGRELNDARIDEAEAILRLLSRTIEDHFAETAPAPARPTDHA